MLVRDGLSSKEIAAELGISHHTVDLHLKRAMKALGAPSRRDAARLLDAVPAGAPGDKNGGNPHTQRLDTQPPGLAEGAAGLSSSPQLRTDRAPRLRVPVLRQGRQTNDLTPMQRLGAIVLIALLLLIAVANFLNGLGALYTITS